MQKEDMEGRRRSKSVRKAEGRTVRRRESGRMREKERG